VTEIGGSTGRLRRLYFRRHFSSRVHGLPFNQSLIRTGATAFFFGGVVAGIASGGAALDTTGVGAGSAGRGRGNGGVEDVARW
jgi:hypothetical protein